METIIILISTLISSLGILFSVCNLYEGKIKIKNKILYVIVLTIIVFILVEYTNVFTKLILNYLSIMFSMY